MGQRQHPGPRDTSEVQDEGAVIRGVTDVAGATLALWLRDDTDRASSTDAEVLLSGRLGPTQVTQSASGPVRNVHCDLCRGKTPHCPNRCCVDAG